jgi:hypothetical protein
MYDKCFEKEYGLLSLLPNTNTIEIKFLFTHLLAQAMPRHDVA